MPAPHDSKIDSPYRNPVQGDTRFDRRLAEILGHATDVFYDKGYEGASMRDLSRATGMSLAGLYYYFESKEKLLYVIQKHTFETILAELEPKLRDVQDPERRIRVFITNHLEYFLANQKAMTVLSHEDGVLKGAFGDEVREIKRRYYQICRDLVEDLKSEWNIAVNARIAVLSLFGMMNWIYTWYRPQVDADAAELGRQMADIFLRGIAGATMSRPKRDGNGRSAVKTAARNPRTASSTI
ncbi:MAG TPA: TetR/AcrR family transcriptional regulator [Terriglobales bacterium]|nr:TetR/AcrR family transcriptional regulator [Terriglobales bacterium]